MMPPIGGVGAVNPVTVHLPQPWIDRIEALAQAQERTRQAQIRWLLRQALKHVQEDADELSEGVACRQTRTEASR
jgi:hypothetical protein